VADLSSFFSFWRFMPKGEKLEGSINFRRHVIATEELHVIFDESSWLGVSLRVAQNSILL
jgi:hypothetical protein